MSDSSDQDADPGAKVPPIPVLWLLGKTGAGKSSLVRAVTGMTSAEIGSGFRPCTRTAEIFDFPPGAPLLRFLDTRGLGEAGYDPAEDIAASQSRSQAILAVMRLDDPVQGEVIDVLAEVHRRRSGRPIIVVLTGADLIADPGARERAAADLAARIAAAVESGLPTVRLSLPPKGPPVGLGDLSEALADAAPEAATLLLNEAARDGEGRAFQALRPRVLFYAGLAGASDVAPLVGALTVPGAQIAMLRELGNRHGVAWGRRDYAAFLSTLGIGIAARYGALFLLRQGGKLIPVVGQTLVAAASGTVSFASTYALGRAAAYWLYHRRAGDAVPNEDLRRIYREALGAMGRTGGGDGAV